MTERKSSADPVCRCGHTRGMHSLLGPSRPGGKCTACSCDAFAESAASNLDALDGMLEEANVDEVAVRRERPHARSCYVYRNAKALVGIDRTGLCDCGAEPPPCHALPMSQWCDAEGPGGFMGHTCGAARRQLVDSRLMASKPSMAPHKIRDAGNPPELDKGWCEKHRYAYMGETCSECEAGEPPAPTLVIEAIPKRCGDPKCESCRRTRTGLEAERVFTDACINAIGEISVDECLAGIAKFRKEHA